MYLDVLVCIRMFLYSYLIRSLLGNDYGSSGAGVKTNLRDG
jgi:hypothetical protein